MQVLVNEPLLDGNEKKYLSECIDSGWISSEGPFVKEFEERIAEYFNRRYAIAVCNGTVAIDIAVDALDLQPGDEVIMPSFTIISCISGILRRGCVPVFVDQEASTWNMDVSQVEGKITPKTKAIMVVHIYGLPVDMEPVLAISKKFKLKIIEDSAEMHGQTYSGKKCGSFGDISTLSFYPNKHITTGEGGMVLTDDTALADRCRSLRNLCFLPERRFVHYELGYNARMTNMQAAIGLAQLERIDEFIGKKRWIGSLYQELLNDLPMVTLPLNKTKHAENIYWVFGIILKKEFRHDASYVMKQLGMLGVGSRPFFWGMHEQPVLKKYNFYKEEKLPVCENMARRGFYLPSGLALSEKQIRYVAEKLREIILSPS
ncbi:MAG: DegT/DnrJ/EryC1/StrS family aminotransferase [Cyclobacteriaceae bacterium]